MLSSFRGRLLFILGTTLLALTTILVSAAMINVRQTRDLETIENGLLPKLELGPHLDKSFEQLRHTMQDAESLSAVGKARDGMFQMIAKSGSALSPAEATALRRSIQDYCDSGLDVSRRMIAGETGEGIVADIAKMQALQAKTSALIESTTRLQPRELADAFAGIHANNRRITNLRIAIALVALVLVSLLSLRTTRALLRSIGDISSGFSRFATGDFGKPIPVASNDELGKLAREANQMASSLERLAESRDRDDWLKTAQVGLSLELQGELDPGAVAERTLRFLARRLEAAAGALYLSNGQGVLELSRQYAGSGALAAGDAVPSFRAGEGLVGQAALSDEVTVIDPCPAGYLKVRSGLGETDPKSLVLVPFALSGEPLGVAELALLKPCSDRERELLASSRLLKLRVLRLQGGALCRELLVGSLQAFLLRHELLVVDA